MPSQTSCVNPELMAVAETSMRNMYTGGCGARTM